MNASPLLRITVLSLEHLAQSFMPSSTLYNGNLRAEDWYRTADRHSVTQKSGDTSVETVSYPKGFFPHGYQQVVPGANITEKKTVASQEKLFKLYLDEGMTRSQALQSIQFVQDGKFIDDQTHSLDVDFITYNADLDIFAQARFFFGWNSAGKIPWDYDLQSVSVNMQTARSREVIWRVLQAAVVIMLSINCVMEIMDVLVEIRKFRILTYVSSPYNWIDWAHFFTTWATCISWLVYETQMASFTINPSYQILQTEGALARVFLTDTQQEVAFLELQVRILWPSPHSKFFPSPHSAHLGTLSWHIHPGSLRSHSHISL